MKSFFETLEDRARQINSLLCVGLDPHPEDLTEPTPKAARAFCLRLIEATTGLALAYKPNSAFFEAFGVEGIAVLKEVIAAVPADTPVILDAKRGDIASTAQAYAKAAFQVMQAQAVTLNPYLGYDAIQPFLSDPERGVFLLCKTSNPGSSDLQDVFVLGKDQTSLRLFEHVAMLAKEWNVHGNLGLVVGANHPEALARVRSLVPDNWILAPGVGAQGGDLQAALHAGLRSDGLGLLIPVSRLLSRAENPRRIGNELIRQINLVRSEVQGSRIESRDSRPVISPIHQSSYDSPITNLDSRLSTLADRLLDAGCIQFGQFTLKSGMQSPIYIDLRRLVSLPELLAQVAAAYLPHLHALTFDRLAALPYAAIPIATAISLQGDWPLIYPRKEAKSYGTRAEIEGIFQPGERVVVIDDLATTGGSKFEAIHKLVEAGLLVSDVVVLVDRQSGAAGALSQGGYLLHSVFTLTQLIDHWRQKSLITPEQYTATLQFLRRET